MHFISILSTLVALFFAAAVFNRYRYKKGPHLLMWGIGLVLYGLATLNEVWLSFAFQPLSLRVYYLSGAMLTAAWLGQGTIHLLVRKRGVAWAMTAGLAVISLVALALVMVAPITSAAAAYDVTRPVSTQYRDILERSPGIVFLTVALNIYGTVALVGGALYSAYIFWRKRVLANRMLGNILIAAGALMPAMAGSLVKIGLADLLYVSELVGVLVMYVGFIQATSVKVTERQPVTRAASQ